LFLMTTILFVHSNFPGQFGFVAQALLARGMRCAAIASATGRQMPGIPLSRWGVKRGSTPGIFIPAARAEADCIRGRAAADCALMLRQKGFVPDLIIGHPGWGETLFLRDIFPKAKQIVYGEYYYRAEGGDVGFDPEFGELSVDERFRVHGMNATMALALSEADRIVCATRYQASLLPPSFAARMTIIHEGIDTTAVRPNRDASLTLANGRLLDRSLPIVTFINRRFEPLRGFHIFMRALPKVLAEVPDCQAVLIGADEPGGYGKPAPVGATWKKHMLADRRTL
jgi:glycosyltransferase involved in cell wall biosynthesis